jgi:hypothetical protein
MGLALRLTGTGLLWVVLTAATPADLRAECVGQVFPAPAPTAGTVERPPLGSLAEGLRWYLSLDGHLQAFSPSGIEHQARFIRSSRAYLPDLSCNEKHEPRFVPGRFGQGVIVESVGHNRFPSRIASLKSAPAGFLPIQGAILGRSPGLKGNGALEIRATAAGSGFQTEPVTVPLSQHQTFSFYVTGTEGQELELSAVIDGKQQPLGTVRRTLAAGWQRIWLDYRTTDQRDPPYEAQMRESPPLQFRVTAARPGRLLVDALMLEAHTGYSGRRSLSSWMDGDRTREGDILSMPAPDAQKGSMAFWFRPLGSVSWRVLVCCDDALRWDWSPDLRLDLHDNRRLELVLSGRVVASKTLRAPLAETEWRHVVLTWDGRQVRVYLDGTQMLYVGNAPPRAQMGRITLGGVATNGSPATRADAVFDEFAQWARPLSGDEARRLAQRQEPLGVAPASRITLADLEPICTFARDDMKRCWHLRLTNRSSSTIGDALVRYGTAGLFERRVSLVPIPAKSCCDFALPWSPALLQPGSYDFQVEVTGRGFDRRYSCPMTIAAARAPRDNVQVIQWAGIDEDLAGLGVTSGGVTGTADGFPEQEVELATRRGLYTQLRQILTGEASGESDRFVDVAGKPGEVDQRSPGPLADLASQAERLADRLARFPDVRQMILNTEHQWLSAHDARPATVLDVKRRFGLDLGRWMAARPANTGQVTLPLGRLSAKAGAYPLPPSGIVPANEPFYAYHRWWLSDGVGNEVFLNDFLARTVRARAPWVQCIAEPVLRRPAVRAFKEQDILEEWFYYSEPTTAIWTQEAAAAAARGSRAQVAGMPQFLFKPGMAAPYAGFPTPHLYREAVWHCIARPLAALTYWNLRAATQRPAEKIFKSQEEIDGLLGSRPDWKTAESRIQRRGEWSSLFLFIPELRDEVARIHRETVQPLGGLLPQWQNRPRRLAVYSSFAAQLFNEVRWPGLGDPLVRAVNELGVPYDVLYDEDFETAAHVLDGYQVVVLPQCAAVAEPAVATLRRFLARGGRVVADDHFGVALAGVTRFSFRGAAHEASEALAKTEQDLLRQYGRTDHPLYVEGMQQASREYAQAGGPTTRVLQTIRGGLTLDCTTPARHVHWNLLEAEGANYLVAVNDLRIPGRHYGHFGRVREDGVAQSAEFFVDSALGPVAYELPAGRPAALEPAAAGRKLRLDLPPAGGRVVIFLPAAIGRVLLDPLQAPPLRGTILRLSGRLLDGKGVAVPGIIPVEAVLTTPGGRRHDYTRYGAMVRGAWSMLVPIAYNEPSGRYTLELRELAGGRRAAITWILPALEVLGVPASNSIPVPHIPQLSLGAAGPGRDGGW